MVPCSLLRGNSMTKKISIAQAGRDDSHLLADIGKMSFIESHGHSASAEDINKYVNEKYTSDVFKAELSDTKNIYHIIYHDGKPAGYSKMILDVPHPGVPIENVTKLERLYLLKAF